jgi:NADPH:quinone reductase-like Zn-dependent oxidoreductase
VTFGGLTGADVKLNVQSMYSKKIKLVGFTGGTRKEFREITICLENSKSEFGRDSN